MFEICEEEVFSLEKKIIFKNEVQQHLQERAAVLYRSTLHPGAAERFSSFESCSLISAGSISSASSKWSPKFEERRMLISIFSISASLVERVSSKKGGC